MFRQLAPIRELLAARGIALVDFPEVTEIIALRLGFASTKAMRRSLDDVGDDQ